MDRMYEALAQTINQLMARLDRMEALMRVRPEVDPVPYDRYRAARAATAAYAPYADPGPWASTPLTDPAWWPRPVGDPAVWWSRPPPGDPAVWWRGPRYDPAPPDITRFQEVGGLDLVEAVAKARGVDAAKLKLDDLRSVRLGDLIEKIRQKGDPAPDWYRPRWLATITADHIEQMRKEELEALSQDLKAETTRIESLSAMVKERIKKS